jgi:phosphoribosyl 1,2-cyclic phosphodiesterase
MKVISLQSGSNGNCIYVEAGGCRLLFDAGLSAKQAELRLAEHGRSIRSVDAVLISHDHTDHARGIGVFQRKFGLRVYATPSTLRAAQARLALGQLGEVRPFRAGDTLKLPGLSVQTIPTPHDGADGSAFVLDDGRRRLGILTDLGHPFAGLGEIIATLDAVVLESNYDPAMLDCGPYPEFLKRRIAGLGGHLSNDESAGLVKAWASPRLQWACLAHLSEQNNDPSLAVAAYRRAVGKALALVVASRYRAGDVLEV